MNPVLDEIVVGVIVLASLAYFVIPAWRGNKKGCGGGCGCSTGKPTGGKAK